MKLALSLLFCLVGLAAVSAQDKLPVTFKVFPPEYEVFSAGDRLSYSYRDDGLRTYLLPSGPLRVNLTAPGSAPMSLSLDVKAGMGQVQAKLEPRTGPLLSVAEAPTGKLPRNLAFSSDGKRLFVALQGEAAVDVYEVPSLKKAGRFIPAEAGASFSDVLAVGAQMWALGRDGKIQLFDASTLAVQGTIELSTSGSAALEDFGSGKVGVLNWDYGSVTLVDVATKKATNVASLGGSLRGFAYGLGTGFATLFDQGKVVGLDGSTWKVKASWNAGKAPRPVAVVGNLVFVGDMGSAQVLVLDAASGKTVTTVGVASNPHQMAVSTQAMVAVASRGRNNPTDYQLAGPEFGKVTVLDAKGTVIGSVWGRNQPTGLGFSADGRYLAFTDFLDNNVELYRVASVH